MSKTRLLFLLAYDGTRYYGWQKTKEGPSIEEEIEKAASQILQEPVLLQAASRTDRGVHATGQVIDCTFTKPVKNLKRFFLSMNELLPKDIRIMKLSYPPDEKFHPTCSAIKKRYLYKIVTGPVCPPHLVRTHWHVPQHIDSKLVQEALPYLLGEHDFKGFSNYRKGLVYPHTHRTLFRTDLEIINHTTYQEWIFTLEGDHFLYKMARTIVGTLIMIGRGKLPKEQIDLLFTSRARIDAGVTAPACGLELASVMYNENLWQVSCKEDDFLV